MINSPNLTVETQFNGKQKRILCIVHVAPGIERLGVELVRQLQGARLSFRIFCPLLDSCTLSECERALVKQFELKYSPLETCHSDEIVLRDRFLYFCAFSKVRRRYVAEVEGAVGELVRLSKINDVYAILEPANDLFSVRLNECGRINNIFYRGGRIRGDHSYYWISHNLSEAAVAGKIGGNIHNNNFEDISCSVPKSDGDYYKSAHSLSNLSLSLYFKSIASSLFGLVRHFFRSPKNFALIYGINLHFLARALRSYPLMWVLCHIFPLKPPRGRFVFLPLQVFPEAATIAPSMGDQLQFIKAVERSLPSDTMLVIKEHTIAPGYRSLVNYARLLCSRRVFMLSPRALVSDIAKSEDCIGMITVSSTAAEEFLARGKRVLVASMTPYYSQCVGVEYLNPKHCIVPVDYWDVSSLCREEIIESFLNARHAYESGLFYLDAPAGVDGLARLIINYIVNKSGLGMVESAL